MSATLQIEGEAELLTNVVQLKAKTRADLKEISADQMSRLYSQACKICGDLPFDSAEAFMVLAYALAIRARLETLDTKDILKMFEAAREQVVAAVSTII